MTIIAKVCQPDNFELNNSWKHSFIISSLYFFGSESFLESTDTFTLCNARKDFVCDCSFSVIDYLLVIQKGTFIHMCDRANYVKEGFTLALESYSGKVRWFRDILSIGFTSLIAIVLFSQWISIFFFYLVFYPVLS